MPTLISYRKHIDALVTRELRLPDGENHQRLGQEIATVDGITYVSLPDGAALPVDQPEEIAASIQTVTLSDALREDIKVASPQVRVINAMVGEKIAEKYSLADEIKLLRTAPSAEFDQYSAHAEACRAWGREQKAALGL